MFRWAFVSMAMVDAREYAKGFVRMPRNDVVPHASITEEMRAAAPAKLDWTSTPGAVSSVKDQGYCGSCWAFSATEGIESGVFMTDGTASPALSPQQIVSCDPADEGCNGGDLPTAFTYVRNSGGLDTSEDYPYSSFLGETESCESHNNVVKVTDFKYAIPPCEGGSCSTQDEDGLKAALNSFGPLSVCINAATFNDYVGDVLSDPCSSYYISIDHCVQLVGYDTTASTPYWKIKNSWAADWGEGGFIRLPMGVNSCGIANEAMFVTATMSQTPSPSPAPVPSPVPEGSCDMQSGEEDCNSIIEGGHVCSWCYIQYAGFYVCLNNENSYLCGYDHQQNATVV